MKKTRVLAAITASALVFSGLVAPQAQAQNQNPKGEQTQSSNPLENLSSNKDGKKGDEKSSNPLENLSSNKDGKKGDEKSSNPLENLSSNKDGKKGDESKQLLIGLGVLAAVLGGIFAVTQLPQVRALLPAQVANMLP